MQTANEKECSPDFEIIDPEIFVIQAFGYDPSIGRLTTALHHKFYESIKSKEKDAFIDCVREMKSPLDIAYACVCCALYEWPDALQHAIANPAFFEHEYARCRDPTRDFFWENFDDTIAEIKHLRHSSHIIEGAADLTRKCHSYRCFEVFMKVRKEGGPLFDPVPFLQKVYEEVKAESSDPIDTLHLQNKFAEPIYDYVLEIGDQYEFDCVAVISLESRNLKLIENMLSSEKAINLLDPDSGNFQRLAFSAAGLGMSKLATTLFEKQKTKNPFSLTDLLRSGFESRNLELIEMVLKFYGSECDTIISEQLAHDLFVYLSLQGRQKLFEIAFPSFKGKSSGILLSPVSMSEEHAAEKRETLV